MRYWLVLSHFLCLGEVTGDKDVDVFIPYWLNTHLIERYASRKRNCPEIYIAPTTTELLMQTRRQLCGKDWQWWSTVFWPETLHVCVWLDIQSLRYGTPLTPLTPKSILVSVFASSVRWCYVFVLRVGCFVKLSLLCVPILAINIFIRLPLFCFARRVFLVKSVCAYYYSPHTHIIYIFSHHSFACKSSVLVNSVCTMTYHIYIRWPRF